MMNKWYRCMECKRRMTRNVFVCDRCANSKERDDKNKLRHSAETVRTQRLSEITVSEAVDTSPYWDYATKHNPKDEDGDVIEDTRSNPDLVDFAHTIFNRGGSERDVLRERLDAAIDELVPEENEIIRLHLEGRSNRQIAKLVGMSHQGIDKMIRRITTILAAKCKEKTWD